MTERDASPLHAGDPAPHRAAFLHSVLNALHAHIAVLDHRGTIIEVNDAWRRFATANAGDPGRCSVGVNYFDVCRSAITVGCDAFALDAYAGIHRVLTGEDEEFHLEYPCDSPTESRTFVLHVVPRGEPGEGVVVSHENISDQTKIKELERSVDALDAFTYTASHGLRQPLRGIRNHAEFAIGSCSAATEPVVVQSLQSIQRLAAHLDALIDGLMRFARIGKMAPVIRRARIADLAAFAVESLHDTAHDPTVEISIDPDLPVVLCDPALIGEVFQNLIANALKYRTPGQCRIIVGWNHDAHWPEFFVTDNGIGIRASDQAAIFDLFRRLHPGDRYGGGAGAGLTIVKRIVEQHGGSIRVESDEGAGSTFFFSLSPPPTAA